jgi:hypothetical protein
MLDNTREARAAPSYGWTACDAATDRSAWHPKLQRLFDYWQAIRPAGRTLPGRQHFDPLAIIDLMPRVWILDVERDPIRFRYRLAGTKEVETLQREVTGRYLDDVHPRLKHDLVMLRRYHFMVEERRPTWRRGRVRFMHDKAHQVVENCMVPFARDGETVDMLVACSIPYDLDGRAY